MTGSITGWVHSIRQGNDDAAKKFWDRWFDRLCTRVSPYSGRLKIYDDEDVATDAFAEFFCALRAGEFASLKDRSEIWKLLATIAVRKSQANYRFENTKRRGGGQIVVSFEEAAQKTAGMYSPNHFSNDDIEELIQSIGNPMLEKVARMKIQGLETREIADEMNCSLRTAQYMVKDLENEILGRKSA